MPLAFTHFLHTHTLPLPHVPLPLRTLSIHTSVPTRAVATLPLIHSSLPLRTLSKMLAAISGIPLRAARRARRMRVALESSDFRLSHRRPLRSRPCAITRRFYRRSHFLMYDFIIRLTHGVFSVGIKHAAQVLRNPCRRGAIQSYVSPRRFLENACRSVIHELCHVVQR